MGRVVRFCSSPGLRRTCPPRVRGDGSTVTKTLTRSDKAAPRDNPAWTLVLAGFGLFMSALDNMVVTTALSVILVSLHGGLTYLEWTVNAYILSFASFLLTGAALGDRFGRKRMFCVGVG